MKNQKKKKGGFGSVLVVFLVIFLLPRLFELLESADFRYALWRLQRWAMRLTVPPRVTKKRNLSSSRPRARIMALTFSPLSVWMMLMIFVPLAFLPASGMV